MLNQNKFDAGRDFFARRPFTSDGRQYAAGDVFPVGDVRLANRLYDQRFIYMAQPAPESVAPLDAPAASRGSRGSKSRRN